MKGIYNMNNSKDNINLKEIEKQFKTMNTEKAKVGLELLKEIYFIKETLERLKADIKQTEVTTEMQQGNYSIQRANPSIKTYNTTLANYTKLIKQLIELLPEEKAQPEGEKLLQFIASGN